MYCFREYQLTSIFIQQYEKSTSKKVGENPVFWWFWNKTTSPTLGKTVLVRYLHSSFCLASLSLAAISIWRVWRASKSINVFWLPRYLHLGSNMFSMSSTIGSHPNILNIALSPSSVWGNKFCTIQAYGIISSQRDASFFTKFCNASLQRTVVTFHQVAAWQVSCDKMLSHVEGFTNFCK